MSHHTSCLTIDLDAIAFNYSAICRNVGTSCEVATAVKSNAYGLGIDNIAPVLQDAGCKTFYVATIQEAVGLRTIIGYNPRILTLNGFQADASDAYHRHRISPVLCSEEEVRNWQGFDKGPLKAALQIDTGMNRLGVKYDAVDSLGLNPGQNVDLILSHFACADIPSHPLTATQYLRFQEVMRYLGDDFRYSLCNSYGVFASADYHLDQVRPGMSLYGLNPTPQTDNPMLPVVNLNARIIQLHKARKAESAGYGAIYTFRRDSHLATVSIGYGDGFFRHFGNKAQLFWHGHPCPIVGRISMDLTIIDITDIPQDVPPPQVGEMLEVIGPHQSTDDLAEQIGSIGYEILTGLGHRHNRIYKHV